MAPPTPNERQLAAALDRLRIVSEVQAIRDGELNYALAPFRGAPPIAVMCGNATCTRPIMWCTLDLLTARVRVSATAAPGSDPAELGVCLAHAGEPMLRWRFNCPRCTRPCVLSNSRMISLTVRAIADGRPSCTPALE